MNYRVLYVPEAEQSLEQIIKSENRSKFLLGDTVRSINKQLVANPFNFGESREAGFYIGFDRPLAINYQILEDVRTVVVIEIWRIDHR